MSALSWSWTSVGRGRDSSLFFRACRKEVYSQNSLALSEGIFYRRQQLSEGAWVVLVEDPGLPVAFGFDIAEGPSL